ncbi:Adhesion G-protein coupled receptor G7 [Camelus dromedarius]|uniref:Adhesion G-protein coupled receptor G7 n=1 Tax=Camelus dromedarius TaxID=9838 RepID=A0A5N4EJ08_CAMDR|nr:Adhesion G-protein coupled receptor G7 [Camelus dromedarius]
MCKETLTTQTSIPIEFCRNGGTWENGRCICPEDWKGLRCTMSPSSLFIKAQEVVNIATQSQNISDETQILTSDASKLTPENITSATRVAGQIFNASRNAIPEAKIVAVTTVSQILDASEDVFQRAAADDNEDSFATLVEQMEMYSVSLGSTTSVVQPNIAVQSVNFSSQGAAGPAGVLFTVLKGTSNSLVSGNILLNTNVDKLNLNEQTELQILLNTSKSRSQTILTAKPCAAATLFWDLFEEQLTTFSNVLKKCFTVIFHPWEKPMIVMKYWRPVVHEMMKANAKACGFVVYQNNKLFQSKTFITKSNFSQKIISSKTDEDVEDQSASVEMVFSPRYNQTEFQLHSYACVYWNFSMKDWDTYGCHKEGVTDGFLHCRCSHTTNFAVLMSFKKDYKYPKSLDVFSTIGCALSTAGLVLTVLFQVVTSCWLAVEEGNGFITSPLLWSFIVPVTIILISNVVIFIIILVKVLWKNNQNLTRRVTVILISTKLHEPYFLSCLLLPSTKKVSSIRKILSTLSIAVVFGITWILAYLMLIGDDSVMIVFSYIFCLFNTTQGLQIFFLYTVRTKIFQDEASKLLNSLLSSTGRVKTLPSVTTLRLRVRMYNMLRAFPALNEHFRLLEPSELNEDETRSQSDQANPST